MKAFLTLLLLLAGIPLAHGQESLAGTTVPPAANINASPTPGSAGSGNVITITGGSQVAVNGVVIGATANVTELYYTGAAPGANGATAHTAYQLNASGLWNGPIIAGNGGTPVSSPIPSSTSNGISDLSNAGAHPVTGFPASKIAYSIHLFPNNVSGSTPDTPFATAVTVWNAYFGNLEKNGTAPVMNLSVGCSCDNSQGQATDDAAFMANWVSYANGGSTQASSIGSFQIGVSGIGETIGSGGGPSFNPSSQQPMSNAWYSWGNFSTQNPNGTLNADATLKGTEAGQSGGQAYYWSQLLYTPTPPVVTPVTTWNPADTSALIALSSNNTIATTTSATVSSQSVRSTTSQSTGAECFAVAAGTITSDFDVGLSNSSYALTSGNGLGGDTTGIGFDPNSTGGLQGIFFGNANLSSGTVASANGENIMMCANFTTDLFYATSAAMRASVGSGTWNNTAGCTPTVAACGISFAGMTCPCFITYNNFQPSSAATIETTTAEMPFAIPAGYVPWDQNVITTVGKPFILIFGANDNWLHDNDNEPRLALAERIAR